MTGVVLALIAIRRRRLRPFWFALGFFALCAGSAAVVVYRTAHGTIQRISTLFAPRDGTTIYTALFGTPVNGCVHIIAHKDQVIPKLDTGIHLRVRTCPAEMLRILQQHRYSVERTITGPRTGSHTDLDDAFNPSDLGDTLMTFHYELLPGRQWRWITTNRDSTEAIVRDVLD